LISTGGNSGSQSSSLIIRGLAVGDIKTGDWKRVFFREAGQEGLHICIHAGEWGPAVNVREAIERLGAERIAHGIRVLEDRSSELARKRNHSVCVTSNYQSGVVPEPGSHPCRMLTGLNVTISTDDPSVYESSERRVSGRV
jgi:adenosine deaminase